uniref:Uncharacterized protein n=1 Tax=biofilter metagenome TaxID=1070537 RepID=A0A1A7GDX4_9ZZZZ
MINDRAGACSPVALDTPPLQRHRFLRFHRYPQPSPLRTCLAMTVQYK